MTVDEVSCAVIPPNLNSLRNPRLPVQMDYWEIPRSPFPPEERCHLRHSRYGHFLHFPGHLPEPELGNRLRRMVGGTLTNDADWYACGVSGERIGALGNDSLVTTRSDDAGDISDAGSRIFLAVGGQEARIKRRIGAIGVGIEGRESSGET